MIVLPSFLVHFYSDSGDSLCGAINRRKRKQRQKLLASNPISSWLVCPACLEEKVVLFNTTLKEHKMLSTESDKPRWYISPDLHRQILMGIVRF